MSEQLSSATRLVAGVDSSTQSCKVVVRDLESGALVRSGRGKHPDATEVSPSHWWDALRDALTETGGLDGVVGIAVGGQQHGMVVLDEQGRVIRDALLWNDTRSAGAAATMIDELGAQAWVERTGSVPVASYTATKLRWLRENEPENADRVAAVCLPHDWLTWRLAGYGPEGESPLGPVLEALATDRSDASGTSYFDAESTTDGANGSYDRDLLVAALGHDCVLPRVFGPFESVGQVHPQAFGPDLPLPEGIAIGPGAGDNAGAALGLDMTPGDVCLSLGTSGVVSAVSTTPARDASGMVSGFADASGHYLPLTATLNAARILDAATRWLGVDYARLDELALSAPSGCDGLVLVPYLEGERTPNLPDATGALHGIRLGNSTQAHLARAAMEGLMCGQADGLDAIRAATGLEPTSVSLIGGGAKSAAVQRIAAEVLGVDIIVPAPGEYVADGAAKQAAAVVTGSLPQWPREGSVTIPAASGGAAIRERYAAARDLHLDKLPD